MKQQPSGFACELRDEDQAEAIVVVAVVGVVVVAVRRPAILRIVVPRPAADNAVRTLDARPYLQQRLKALIVCAANTSRALFAGMPAPRRVG